MPPAIPLGYSFISRLTQGDEKPGQVFFPGSGGHFFLAAKKEKIPVVFSTARNLKTFCFLKKEVLVLQKLDTSR